MRRSFVVEMFAGMLLLVAAVVAGAAWEAAHLVRDFHESSTAAELETEARSVQQPWAALLRREAFDDLRKECAKWAAQTGRRVTVILLSGKVVADSDDPDVSKMDNHGDRPEVKNALAGTLGRSVRFSHTLQCDFFYVALPLQEAGVTVGAVRLSAPLKVVESALTEVYKRIAVDAVLIAAVASLLGLYLTRRWTRPIHEISVGVRRLAEGDFDARIAPPRYTQLREIVTAVNTMSGDLKERIKVMTRQRNDLDAILVSMSEGVVAVNRKERV